MRFVEAILSTLIVIGSPARAKEANTMTQSQEAVSRADIQFVSPALDQFTQERLFGEV